MEAPRACVFVGWRGRQSPPKPAVLVATDGAVLVATDGACVCVCVLEGRAVTAEAGGAGGDALEEGAGQRRRPVLGVDLPLPYYIYIYKLN